MDPRLLPFDGGSEIRMCVKTSRNDFGGGRVVFEKARQTSSRKKTIVDDDEGTGCRVLWVDLGMIKIKHIAEESQYYCSAPWDTYERRVL
jgi:hypothetical protein